MIIKIQPAGGYALASIAYNEKKATGEEGIHKDEDLIKDLENHEQGHIVVSRNIPEDSTIEEEFERLRILNMKSIGGRKLNNTLFHMSVNPGKNDKPLSEEEVVSFVDELMEELGYGEVPYRIYKHTDIERAHFHVVASRIGQDGKKIKDSYENKRANVIANKLAEKYGFTVGLDKEEKTVEEKQKEDTRNKKISFRPFDINSPIPVTQQYKNFHEEIKTWTFTTMRQYIEIMRERFNVDVLVYDNGVNFSGMDADGNRITPLVNQSALGLNCIDDINQIINNKKNKKHIRQKERLEEVIKWSSLKAKTYQEFINLLKKKGVDLIVHKTDQGDVFGLTWLDRATRHAWKGSDVKFNVDWFKLISKQNSWSIPVPKGTSAGKKAVQKTVRPRRGGGGGSTRDETGDKIDRGINQLRNSFINTPSSDTSNSKDDVYEDEAEKIMNGKIM